MGITRGIMVVLVIMGLTLQGQLWLSADGYQKTRNLRVALERQQRENEWLRARNAVLDAEVVNLKNGREAAEERARTDLGMIGASETFYQVVPFRGPSAQ